MGDNSGHKGNYICEYCKDQFKFYYSKCPNCLQIDSLYRLDTYKKKYGELP